MGEVALTPRLDRRLARLTRVVRNTVLGGGISAWAYNQGEQAVTSFGNRWRSAWEESRRRDAALTSELNRRRQEEKRAETLASRRGLDKVKRRLFSHTHRIYGPFSKKKRYSRKKKTYRTSYKKRYSRSRKRKVSRKKKFYR